jgi:hypothetical protein
MMSSGTVVNWASVALRVPASWASEVLEQDMRLPVEHPMALLNDGKADGLREVTLARARRNSHILRSFRVASPSTIPGIRSSIRR